MFSCLIAPHSYSSARKLADLYIAQLFSGILVFSGLYKYAPCHASNKKRESYTVLTQRLYSHWPTLNTLANVCFNIQEQEAALFFGSVFYNKWLRKNMNLLKKNSLIPKNSHHVYMRPFLKCFRKELSVFENLETLFVLHGLFYDKAKFPSMRQFFSSLFLEGGLDISILNSKTGDVSREIVESCALLVCNSQSNIVYTFHPGALKYLNYLSPVMYIAALDATLPSFFRDSSIICIEAPEVFSLIQCFSPASSLDLVTNQLIDEDEDEDEGEDVFDEAQASGSLMKKSFLKLPSRYHKSLDNSVKISPNSFKDAITFLPWKTERMGVSAIYDLKLFAESQDMSVDVLIGLLESCLFLFLPKPAKLAAEGLRIDTFSICRQSQILTLNICQDALVGLDYLDPSESGWGRVFAFNVKDNLKGKDIAKLIVSRSPMVPLDLVSPFLFMGQVEFCKFLSSPA